MEKQPYKILHSNETSDKFKIKEEFDVYFRNQNSNNPYIIIRNDKEQIGQMSFERTKEGLQLKGITIDEKCRGQGIGTYLFEWALNNVHEPIISLDKDRVNEVEIPKVYKNLENKGYKIS